MPTPPSSRVSKENILLFLCLLCFAYCVLMLVRQCAVPTLSDSHGFRQAQTAISAYWMEKEGNFFAYSTPVLGSPWSIPFEFPLYQGIVALFHKAVPFCSLTTLGRIVSFLFALGCLWPIYRIILFFFKDRAVFLLFASFFFVSPYYVFWSATFMIESAALFFSLAGLWGLLKFSASPTWKNTVCPTLFFTLAALVKITTLPAFFLFGFLYLLYKFKASLFKKDMFIKVVIMAGLPILCLYVWTAWADHLKAENLYGTHLVSNKVTTWNFGTLRQRLSLLTWERIFGRNIKTTLGYAWPFLFIFPLVDALLFRKKRFLKVLLLSFALYLCPLLIFTNLHFVHSYYQYPASIFLIFILAFSGYVFWNQSKTLSLFFLIGLLICNVAYTFRHPKEQNLDRTESGEIIRQISLPDTAVIVLGTEWSSEVLYYAERKGIAVPSWNYNIDEIREKHLTGALPISVVADLLWQPNEEQKRKREKLTAGMKSFPFRGYTIYYDPTYCVIP